MNTVFIIVLIMLMGVMNLLAFLIGARTAQKAHRGEEIKMPTLNPIKAYDEHIEHIRASKEEEERKRKEEKTSLKENHIQQSLCPEGNRDCVPHLFSCVFGVLSGVWRIGIFIRDLYAQGDSKQRCGRRGYYQSH
mgnify:CR=1 FL=1